MCGSDQKKRSRLRVVITDAASRKIVTAEARA
jgi:hypothetical protein